jgi:hypothetical protein
MTSIACPVCAGPVELVDARATCLIGHDFEPGALREAVQSEADRALWMAVRALEDSVSAARWSMTQPGLEPSPYLYDTINKGAKAAELIRDLISGREGSDSETDRRPENW